MMIIYRKWVNARCIRTDHLYKPEQYIYHWKSQTVHFSTDHQTIESTFSFTPYKLNLDHSVSLASLLPGIPVSHYLYCSSLLFLLWTVGLKLTSSTNPSHRIHLVPWNCLGVEHIWYICVRYRVWPQSDSGFTFKFQSTYRKKSLARLINSGVERPCTTIFTLHGL